ncbi:phosphoenolpyruvate kinase [bacterium (Candidatus Blackallbacteria) CG17_big_fil_post_rev_8_21_14_2_50_48_46]|uniref:Phosphoenolpyruvate kinase n=1 Tax=bacterium (Candidatus Blackallbacteria) CG17_big_fil_post_rev_8_21_14_2_50_48_46 TaxID=2014261 RepID=A0A2M7G406_9BACT|nr:MAG: phosphoenolpyruvate kinase [bacterium (Candidatus Blackallbacteria) CG18_big_fil_WC_8_21_14_2_50_49_26]PIW16501.1 MAG: phosphoenolpyruvate kinase [bacterium (Candidatus Blackallbacteria) CG17_big_fil_post_rev_8_21_14_2_50_48_46]PIW46009.1 MAG: phosphoenolpyruvate kinase [bacterium (Candidatus Blackallbacteria) CG13_big_fil_rev_8_21_14_2_50_49_14]
MRRSLPDSLISQVAEPLNTSNQAFADRYPGIIVGRQPVHTLYGGAQLFKAETAQKMGELSLKALENYAPNFAIFARAAGLNGAEYLPAGWNEAEALAESIAANPDEAKKLNRQAWLAWTIYERVKEKLGREAVEDFRIDFEDGYGNRPDAEEDADAVRNAQEVARGMAEGILPPFIGIRIKPWTEQLFQRSVRTLDIFMSALLDATGGHLPQNFVVTLPKVTSPEQVAGLVQLLEHLEAENGLPQGSIPLEIMVETTQSMFDFEGEIMLPAMLTAAAGRCRGAHFGTYDYTASCSIIARYQSMDHPACDFSRHIMQVALASTGVMLSDGATNIMPVPVHRETPDKPLNAIQIQENTAAVHAAWKLHVDHIRHSLTHAYYQGWDLHPAQLITRYATLFDFFLSELDGATVRLKNFIAKAAQATLSGDVFDDAATGRGLLNYFRLAYNCSAITAEEVEAAGLSVDELQGGAGSGSSPWLQMLSKV